MFIRNKTRHRVALPHGYVSEDTAVAAVVIETRFHVFPDRLVPEPALDGRRAATDLPDLLLYPEWEETSVTVSGHVSGPPHPPYVRPVLLRVGADVRRLIVFGERRWRRGLGGALSASAPAPFHEIPLAFERAYGGSFDEPPGLCPDTGLPTPGGPVGYPLNETGIGFYPDADHAQDQVLPNIEWPHQLVTSWSSRPEPAGFSPCPTLHALRAPPSDADAYLHHQHVAPAALIFPTLSPGTEIALEGVGAATLAFAVPGFPAVVATKPALRNAGAWSTRAVHVDADAGAVLVVQGYAFSYTATNAPQWIDVVTAR